MRRSHRGDDEPVALVTLQGGNVAAHRNELFAELALPALDDLYRMACRLEREPDRARDLVQETLLVGLRRFDQLQARGAFRSWVARILYRVFLNSRRRRREEPLEETDPSAGPWSAEPPLDPEERFLARQRSAALAGALDELPRRQRLAVFLVDLQGFSYAEAAAALEVPAGTVASRVVRGRHALRRALRAVIEGDRDDR